MNKIKSLIFSTAFLLSSLAIMPHAAQAAGAASLGLSPASGGRTVGSTFSVAVVENSGATAVNGVEADLNYDTSKLRFLGKSCSGGFEVTAPSAGANIACATITPKSGGQSVGTASFKVIATGSSAISFLSSSQITAADGQGTNVWNGSPAGGSYSFAAAAPVVSTPVAAAPAVTAAPQVKKAVVKHAVAAPVIKSDNSGKALKVSAIVVGILAVLAGLGFLLRKYLAPYTAKIKTVPSLVTARIRN